MGNKNTLPTLHGLIGGQQKHVTGPLHGFIGGQLHLIIGGQQKHVTGPLHGLIGGQQKHVTHPTWIYWWATKTRYPPYMD